MKENKYAKCSYVGVFCNLSLKSFSLRKITFIKKNIISGIILGMFHLTIQRNSFCTLVEGTIHLPYAATWQFDEGNTYTKPW